MTERSNLVLQPPPTAPPSTKVPPIMLVDLVAGSMGGFAMIGAGYPFDTVKVRMAKYPHYNGMWHTLTETLRHEGIRGLYKGCASPLSLCCFLTSTSFFTYGVTKRALEPHTSNYYFGKLNGTAFLAGAMNGFICSFIEGPMDLIKSKIQVQRREMVATNEYRGVFQAARIIYNKYGVRGLYQGLSATSIRNTWCYAWYFSCYETTRKITTDLGIRPMLGIWISGAASGLGYWCLNYPLDVIKTSLQTDASQVQHRKYKGYIDCCRQIVQKNGLKGLWRGYVPVLFRAVPVNSSVWVAVELTRNHIYAFYL